MHAPLTLTDDVNDVTNRRRRLTKDILHFAPHPKGVDRQRDFVQGTIKMLRDDKWVLYPFFKANIMKFAYKQTKLCVHSGSLPRVNLVTNQSSVTWTHSARKSASAGLIFDLSRIFKITLQMLPNLRSSRSSVHPEGLRYFFLSVSDPLDFPCSLVGLWLSRNNCETRGTSGSLRQLYYWLDINYKSTMVKLTSFVLDVKHIRNEFTF